MSCLSPSRRNLPSRKSTADCTAEVVERHHSNAGCLKMHLARARRVGLDTSGDTSVCEAPRGLLLRCRCQRVGKGVVMQTKIALRAQLEARIKPDADVGYVAWCPALDVSSQGTSIRNALAALTEAVELFLEVCFENGTLDIVLRELGFTEAHKASEASFPDSEYTIEVPMELIADATNRRRSLEATG
ncbi:MAG: type II toxin-antitoxin system HicB family antitoxin [Dokdonella sp.]